MFENFENDIASILINIKACCNVPIPILKYSVSRPCAPKINIMMFDVFIRVTLPFFVDKLWIIFVSYVFSGISL